MTKEERQLDAAEYVIGTLSELERTAFEASIDSDSEVRADVRFWERHFGALNASIAPEPVPSDLWDRVQASLPPQNSATNGHSNTATVMTSATGVATAGTSGAQSTVASNDNQLSKLQKSRGRWRLGAVAASLAAILLGAYAVNDRLNIVPLPGQENSAPGGQLAGKLDGKQFIAVVNANGDQPSLVVSVNAETGDVKVRSVGVERPDGKSLELWYVPEGQSAISVGLVGEGGIDLKDISAKNGDLLAISVEPKGGSPTGTATGPVIYTGKLIKDPAAE